MVLYNNYEEILTAKEGNRVMPNKINISLLGKNLYDYIKSKEGLLLSYINKLRKREYKDSEIANEFKNAIIFTFGNKNIYNYV